ncbi:MAG: type II secretion system protein N, partial [Pseudomonadota bacterium]
LVMLVLLAALAYQVSLMFWHIYPAPAGLSSGQQVRVQTNTVSQQAAPNYQQQAIAISRAYLFGKLEVQETVVEVEEAPETQLNYKLRGIYFSPEPSLSSAIIEVQANKSQHYLLDDELAENITLAGIEADHILINRYGKIERLNLQKREASRGGSISSSLPTAASGSHTVLLRSYKQRYVGNPMALATRFQAIPVQQDGKNVGFKLKPLRGETLLKKLDFQPDDVFTAVNGISLNNPFEAVDALKSLTTANSLSVTFMRNGAEQTMDFKI